MVTYGKSRKHQHDNLLAEMRTRHEQEACRALGAIIESIHTGTHNCMIYPTDVADRGKYHDAGSVFRLRFGNWELRLRYEPKEGGSPEPRRVLGLRHRVGFGSKSNGHTRRDYQYEDWESFGVRVLGVTEFDDDTVQALHNLFKHWTAPEYYYLAERLMENIK